MQRIALSATLVMAVLVVGLNVRVQAASPLDAGTMKAALRTATPEEDGFIEKVANLVEKGKLPRSLVESSFQFARTKDRLRFQYFRQALAIRADRMGYNLWDLLKGPSQQTTRKSKFDPIALLLKLLWLRR